MKLSHTVLRELLEEKTDQYNRSSFIETDPISIPHAFSRKEDIEISAFLVATIAWGQRVSIINNGNRLMELMGQTPYEFVTDFKDRNKSLERFVHRTFNGKDITYFIKALRNIYCNHGGLEAVFSHNILPGNTDLCDQIVHFRNTFFELRHPERTRKHISNPADNSAAKRINMYLRWMVRTDKRGVDFGLWKNISPSLLSCPLDIHSGNVARKLGLLKRSQNDWKAVHELTEALKRFDANDPVKYDFALFGLGAFEGFR
jgi:uncharacterized protein (TIGR02757 family)